MMAGLIPFAPIDSPSDVSEHHSLKSREFRWMGWKHPMKNPRAIRYSAVVLAIAAICESSQSPAADWPQFGRDGTRNAVSPERRPPTDWDVGKWTDTNPRRLIEGSSRNVKWSAPLGWGTYGDPVVTGGMVWVGTNNSPWSATDKRDASVLACFRESDGKLLYRYVSPRLPKARIHDWEQSSIRCSPLIDDDRLWFVTNRAEVVCLDIAPLRQDGGEPAVLWKVDLTGQYGVFPRGSMMHLGHACSIAGYRDLIYVITGNGVDETFKQVARPDAPSLICFNRNTGDAVWQDNSPGQNILCAQWASPTIIEIDGRAQCVAPQGDGWVRSFDALSGKLIWKFDMNRKESRWALERSQRNDILASPVFADNRVFIARGRHPEFGEGGGRLVCLDPTRQGDISSELAVDSAGKLIPHRRVQAVDAAQAEQAVPNPGSGLVWEFTKHGAGKKFIDVMHDTLSNVAVCDGLVIAPDQVGMVHCLDARTGLRNWAFDALNLICGSPLIVDDKVYVADSDGKVMVFGLSSNPEIAMRKVDGEFRPLRELSVTDSVDCSPIYANGVLYLATHSGLYAVAGDPQEPDQDRAAGYWPQWRGPDRSNISPDTRLLPEWPKAGPPLVWRLQGLGDGVSPTSIGGGRIFSISLYDTTEYLRALDEQTGEALWSAVLAEQTLPQSRLMRWYTQRSPTIDGERLYVISLAGELTCFQTHGGKKLWRKNYITDFAGQHQVFGYCDSPLVEGEKLICTPGGDAATIVALDKQTGEVLWKCPVAGEGRAAYSNGVLTTIAGQRQFVTCLGTALVGVSAESGQLLWRHGGSTPFRRHHTPFVRDGLVTCINGLGGGITQVKVSHENGAYSVAEVYASKVGPLAPFQDDTVFLGERLYDHANGAFACFDVQTGTRIWAKRMGLATAIAYADGRFYFHGDDGRVRLVEVVLDEPIVKGEFVLPDHQDTLGTTRPIVTGGRLYVREDDQLFCFDVRDRSADPTRAPRSIQLERPATAVRAADEKPERTLRSVFVPTPQDVVVRMLQMAEVKKSDVVYDLGSGDGRIVIAAAKTYGCRAVGYELNKELVASSRANAQTAGVQSLVTIEGQDLFEADLGRADVLAVYLLPQQLQKLVPQLEKMKAGSRVVSHQFEIPGFTPDKVEIIAPSDEDGGKHTVYLWTLPLRQKIERR